jgi:hypothetical protein
MEKNVTKSSVILVYRDNETWRALKAELAQRFGGKFYRAGGMVDVDQLIVQIFPEGTPEAQIEAWVEENRAMLQAVGRIVADSTVQAALARHKIWSVYNLDQLFVRAAERLLRGTSVHDVYRKVFATLVEKLGIEDVQIVVENVADYNPLGLAGCDRVEAIGDNDRYARAFKDLIPAGVKVRLVRAIQMEVPGVTSLAICHHHAHGHLTGGASTVHPRVLMPYLKGFIEKASALCDISHVWQGDLLEEVRKDLCE